MASSIVHQVEVINGFEVEEFSVQPAKWGLVGKHQPYSHSVEIVGEKAGRDNLQNGGWRATSHKRNRDGRTSSQFSHRLLNFDPSIDSFSIGSDNISAQNRDGNKTMDVVVDKQVMKRKFRQANYYHHFNTSRVVTGTAPAKKFTEKPIKTLYTSSGIIQVFATTVLESEEPDPNETDTTYTHGDTYDKTTAEAQIITLLKQNVDIHTLYKALKPLGWLNLFCRIGAIELAFFPPWSIVYKATPKSLKLKAVVVSDTSQFVLNVDYFIDKAEIKNYLQKRGFVRRCIDLPSDQVCTFPCDGTSTTTPSQALYDQKERERLLNQQLYPSRYADWDERYRGTTRGTRSARIRPSESEGSEPLSNQLEQKQQEQQEHSTAQSVTNSSTNSSTNSVSSSSRGKSSIRVKLDSSSSIRNNHSSSSNSSSSIYSQPGSNRSDNVSHHGHTSASSSTRYISYSSTASDSEDSDHIESCHFFGYGDGCQDVESYSPEYMDGPEMFEPQNENNDYDDDDDCIIGQESYAGDRNNSSERSGRENVQDVVVDGGSMAEHVSITREDVMSEHSADDSSNSILCHRTSSVDVVGESPQASYTPSKGDVSNDSQQRSSQRQSVSSPHKVQLKAENSNGDTASSSCNYWSNQVLSPSIIIDLTQDEVGTPDGIIEASRKGPICAVRTVTPEAEAVGVVENTSEQVSDFIQSRRELCIELSHGKRQKRQSEKGRREMKEGLTFCLL